jgi:2-polyprenyl-6-methoxyphenol hydroxylase-like FAD-dependent oxidoreductase
MEPTRVDTTVLIVGAGPTGLALACDLGRRGVAFRIIDRAPAYFAGSRGKGLQPRSLEVLDDFGLVDRILENGRFHIPFRAYDGATVLGEFDMHEGRHPTPNVPYASSLIIPQWRVEETLRQCVDAAGAHVELAAELTAIEQDEEGVTATVQQADATRQIRCRYLVGADGAHSFVRKSMNIGFEGETWKDERMLVGDVRVDGLDRDHWHSWPRHEKGWVALCPLPSTESFQFQAQIAADVDGEPTLATFQGILNERSGRTDLRLSEPTWISLYRANVRMVDRYRVGRVFLAGDAAHVHSPAGGQGMNTGIQDAYNLGWKLAAVLNGATEALLHTYEEERLPVAADMLGITTRLHRQVFSTNVQAMRRGPETLQLDLNYRGSSLSWHDDLPQIPLQAGDRAPDAPLVDRQGKRVRLFDVFRGTHFTLLNFGHDNLEQLNKIAETQKQILRLCSIGADAFPGLQLSDTDGHARLAYVGEEKAFFLVRPDGYIGVLGDSRSIDRVENYLNHIHGAPV